MDINTKYQNLKETIKSLESVLVAFSGGVDSALLLKTCVDVLGREHVKAVINASPIHPGKEIEEATYIAGVIGVDYIVIATSEMEDPDFLQNTKERCYYCKLHLFDALWDIAHKIGFPHVVEGSNLDDTKDFRPGSRACREKNIISPLQMAELTKKEVRSISQNLLLATHDKPSNACLASRIPYGTQIDKNLLKRIERAEDALKALGIRQTRVRYHGILARIEVGEEDFNLIMDNRNEIAEELRKEGFVYITLDIEGYRTGSMNEESFEG